MSRPANLILLGVTLASLAAVDVAAQSNPPKTKLIVSPKALTFKNSNLQLSFTVSAAGGTIQGYLDAPAPPFQLTSRGGPFSLADGQSLRVIVRFSPPAKGTYESRINVTSNANRNPNQSVSLIGKAETVVP
jgi:hypothetical protein